MPKVVERYAFDAYVQCCDCLAEIVARAGGPGEVARRMSTIRKAARTHVIRTGHKVEVISATVERYA